MHRSVSVSPNGTVVTTTTVLASNTSTPSDVASATATLPSTVMDYGDAPLQQPLADPPAIVKGIYLTAWTAGSPGRMQQIINLIKGTEVNTVVIDLKDYSGYVSYAMDVPAVKASGAEDQIRITHPNELIKKLHDNGIYVIGRITNFQDPILAKAHPEWALHNAKTGGVWVDNNGLAWMDPAAKPVWNYLASIAKDAFGRGFDEVQFDYIRFASDGALGNISYPYWDEKTPRSAIIENYFQFLRQQFPNNKISADLFGLSTVNNDDLGIGQVIQDAYENFDYVSPMVYPSHYATGFLGYKYPAAYPYQVVNYSMTHAVDKLVAMGDPPVNTSSTAKTASGKFDLGYVPSAKLRPWLQDFDLGVPGAPGTAYTPAMVQAQKQAVYNALDTTSTSQYYGGWILWNAANTYKASDFNPQ